MAIFRKSINIPIILEIEEGILKNVNKILKKNSLYFQNPLIVTGKGSTKNFGKIVGKGFRKPFFAEVKTNFFSEVTKLEDFIEQFKPDVVIGVGGGKVIDSSKFASMRKMKPFISIPTTLSNDGLSSPISVIRFKKEIRSIGVGIPTGVIIDLAVIKNAPEATLKAGAGDLISNLSATFDWKLAKNYKNEYYDEFAVSLARNSAYWILQQNKTLKDDEFLFALAEGLALSGIAMGIAGTSRPCSGSEHLISHAIDSLYNLNSFHGEQVGIASLFTLYLQNNKHWEMVKEFMQRYGLASTPQAIGLSKEAFLKAVKYAPSTRKDRFTILNLSTHKELIEAYSKVY